MNNIDLKLNLIDIGARGGIQWPWTKFDKSKLSTILVEPDFDEANRLKKLYKNFKDEIFILPIALWSKKTEINLNLTKSLGASSVFEPNTKFLEQFPEVDRFSITKKVKIKTDTIDSIINSGKIKMIDFAKIDVQGAELEILKGAQSHFRSNLVGLELEVEFADIYKKQPFFSDIDSYIRNSLGLELWDINKSCWKYKDGYKIKGPAKGRLIFGDALYFRPLTNIDLWLKKFSKLEAKEKILKLFYSVLGYGYIDYAASILKNKSILYYLDKETIKYMNSLLKKSNSGIIISSKVFRLFYWLFSTLANIFRPSYNGWATRSDRQLGVYKYGPFWYY